MKVKIARREVEQHLPLLTALRKTRRAAAVRTLVNRATPDERALLGRMLGSVVFLKVPASDVFKEQLSRSRRKRAFKAALSTRKQFVSLLKSPAKLLGALTSLAPLISALVSCFITPKAS